MKTIKVKLNNSVSHWGYPGHRYVPGDVFDVPKNLFVPYLMTEVSALEKKVSAKKKKEVVEETEDSKPIVPASDVTSKLKPRRGRR